MPFTSPLKIICRHFHLSLSDSKRHFCRRIQFTHQPLKQLEYQTHSVSNKIHSQEKYTWQSLGEDPALLLRPTNNIYPRGWYMIELRLNSNQILHNANLYFDYGEGFNQEKALVLPLESQKVAKRICFLPKIPKLIRFDPTESQCKFSIRQLDFVKVTKRFALGRIRKKLRSKHPDYLLCPFKKLIKKLRNEAQDTDSSLDQIYLDKYSECFKAHKTSNSYADWISNSETPVFSNNCEIQRKINELNYKPLISLLVPVFNTEERFLRRCIESVIVQSYPHWELCVADDASSDRHVREILQTYAIHDPRIKLFFREENGHISEASNSALSIAIGDYVGLLDHDDELSQQALFSVINTLNQQSDARIIYSDEDKIDADGNRFEPHFKSDWNPDLLLSQNYISHLCVYKRDLIYTAGCFRKGFEGSQDYDLLLRAVKLVLPGQIVHIPQVLYHWRMLKGSTAWDAAEKSYTTETGIKALRDYFAEPIKNVSVTQAVAPNTYKITWPIPDPPPLVSLLIPTRNGFDLLARCLSSILEKTTYPSYEIIILDNRTTDPQTLEYLASFGDSYRVRVLRYDRSFNYSAINNFGVDEARGTIIGLINNDIEVISPDWLTEMVSHACRPEIGCVGAKLYYGNDTVQHAGVITGLGGVAGHSHKYYPKDAPGYFYRLQLVQNLSAVTGAALLVRKAVYEQVGGLNENHLTVAFNDVDFCLRVGQAGYRNLWTPYAEMYHHESASRGTEDTPEKQRRFQREVAYMKGRWGNLLSHDPAYNPNLTLDREDFSLSQLNYHHG